MGYVYILQSIKTGVYYIGSSKDYQSRLKQHNAGRVTYTRNLRPWKLVFFQEYESIKLAKTIERRLKNYKSRKIIEKIVKDGIIYGPVAQR